MWMRKARPSEESLGEQGAGVLAFMTLVEIPTHVLVMKPKTELVVLSDKCYKRCNKERPLSRDRGV